VAPADPRKRFYMLLGCSRVPTQTVSSQERWITKTEAFLPKALQRISRHRKRGKITPARSFWVRIAPVELLAGKLVGFFPFTFSPSFRSRVVGARRRILPLSRFFHFNSRGLTQASGLYPTHTKYGLARSGQPASSWRFLFEDRLWHVKLK
jgi:hypothetical protein